MGLKRKTPRGWIQIGESRTRGVARIPRGLTPSRDSRTTSQRDSPIWIQPLGVFRYSTWLSISKFNAGLEGFGQYPVFTAVFTGKYRPGKNRFWTPKVGKTGKNTTWLYNQFHISIKGSIWLWNTLIKDMRILSSSVVHVVSGLEGFGQYPVFTAVFTGKYRPGKNRFWTPKVGKTGKNTTWLYNQFHISIKGSIWLWNTLIKDMRILSSSVVHVVWTIVSK